MTQAEFDEKLQELFIRFNTSPKLYQKQDYGKLLKLLGGAIHDVLGSEINLTLVERWEDVTEHNTLPDGNLLKETYDTIQEMLIQLDGKLDKLTADNAIDINEDNEISVTSHIYTPELHNSDFGRNNQVKSDNTVVFGENNALYSGYTFEFVGYLSPYQEGEDNECRLAFEQKESGSIEEVVDIPDLQGVDLYLDDEGQEFFGTIVSCRYSSPGKHTIILTFKDVVDKSLILDSQSIPVSTWGKKQIPIETLDSKNDVILGSDNKIVFPPISDIGFIGYMELPENPSSQDFSSETSELEYYEGSVINPVFTYRLMAEINEVHGASPIEDIPNLIGSTISIDDLGNNPVGKVITAARYHDYDDESDWYRNVILINLDTEVDPEVFSSSRSVWKFTPLKINNIFINGVSNTVKSSNSHAEGEYTTVTGETAHTEGYETTASGDYSHAEGYFTESAGQNSHSEGSYTTASGNSSHSEGEGGNVTLFRSASEGVDVTEFNIYTIQHSSDSAKSFFYGSDFMSDSDLGGVFLNTYGKEKQNKLGGWIGRPLYRASGELLAIITDIVNSTIYVDRNIIVQKDEPIYIRTGASGMNAHSEGFTSDASGKNAHAEGERTLATGTNAHSEGYHTKAFGMDSHAEGYLVEALAVGSHAEGWGTHAEGEYSHVEGTDTKASGESAHAEGHDTEAESRYSHAEGLHSKTQLNIRTSGTRSYTVYINNPDGKNIKVRYNGSENDYQTFISDFSVGSELTTSLYTIKVFESVQEPENNNILNITLGTTSTLPITNGDELFYIEKVYYIGEGAHAEGKETLTFGSYSHAEGLKTLSLEEASHAEGVETKAQVYASHAEGIQTIASGSASHAEGNLTRTWERYSHAEGDLTAARGKSSHAEGECTEARGYASHAEGSDTRAYGEFSHAEGVKTEAKNFAEHAQGFRNKSHYNSDDWGDKGNTLFSVGSGGNFIDVYVSEPEFIGYLRSTNDWRYPVIWQYYEGSDRSVNLNNCLILERLEGTTSDIDDIPNLIGSQLFLDDEKTQYLGKVIAAARYNPSTDIDKSKCRIYIALDTDFSAPMDPGLALSTWRAEKTEDTEPVYTEGEDQSNALEITQNGSVYVRGVGDYRGDNIDSATSLQTLIKRADPLKLEPLFETIAAALNELNRKIEAIDTVTSALLVNHEDRIQTLEE